MAINVALIEDNRPEREFLESLLARTDGLACVGAWSSVEPALREIPPLQPHVILLDYRIPESTDGLRCLRQLREYLPGTPVIMWTIEPDTDKLFAALETGAVGYLLKGSSPGDLTDAILDAHQGGSPMTPMLARRVVLSFRDRAAKRDPTPSLSERERQILDRLAQGFTNKEIGAQLDISEYTVRSHLRRTYEKLQVRNRAEAVGKTLRQP